MHSGLIPSHLEHLAQSVVFNTVTANTTAIEDAHTNYLIRANSTGESLRNKQLQLQLQSSGGSTSSTTEVGGIGLSVQEAIILDNADDDEINNVIVDTGQSSIFQNPTLIDSSIRQQQYGKNAATNNSNNNEVTTMMMMVQAERDTDQLPSIDIKATHWDMAHQTAETMREFLTLREKVRLTDYEIRSLEASMTHQQDNMNMLNKKINDIATGGTGTDENNNTAMTMMTATEKLEKTEQCKVSQQESGRVICQLQRKLSDLITNQNSRKLELTHLETKARTLNKKRQSIVHAFRDPFTSWKGDLAKGSRVGGCVTLQSIVGREQGLSRARLSRYQSRSNISKGQNPVHFLEFRKNLLSTRLSHAVTINTHMNCPVYCLRFDRTGRYFITGADDFLLKVFYLGAGQSCRTTDRRSRQLRCNYGANFRGAVLVCTLRGHAGVINDIDVSLDNCFLATASDDGDVRVWGLKTGCPIAILRGHKGGANMVSWSTLTPYRLVSTGSDGFARVWDIREACLKRYSNMVGQREEYNSRLTDEEKNAQMDRQKKNNHNKALSEISAQTKSLSSTTTTDTDGVVTAPSVESLGPPVPPPLPLPGTVPTAAATGSLSEPASGDGVELVSENNNNNNNEIAAPGDGGIIVPPLPAGIIVPPLPAAVPPLGQGADGGNQGNQNAAGPGGQDAETAPGQFVFNDLIDEGVKLLSKYQHGSIQEEHHGPGTRSRRGAINVICVARCPLGKQFVTGSDDAICRVWEDFDDSSVEIIDGRLNNNNKMNLDTFLKSARPSRSGIENKPLLKLMGHVSTITDLSYSNAGDRILSASQKDGVVRLWNIGIAALAGSGDRSVFKDKRVTQIVIKLTNPFSKQASQPTRRRKGNAARNASSKVCCDVAVWTHDDSYIITSQCVLIKENTRPIQPGSQFLCLWDSKSGQCLIGISGAHTLNCQVVIPHPMDASIFCTGSIDGTAKVWDLTQGKCIFTHRNKVELGPPDPKKPTFAGYLDGSFSPDGSAIVLTDECGQITVLDSTSKEDNPPNSGNSLKWMREQYFANDYYDLAYDTYV
ncbi:MAG: WD40 repeat protein [Bacillariaceae sp.]|jgi:WD40 repeat protein